MRVLEPSEMMQPPMICSICEQLPDVSTKVVDTQHHHSQFNNCNLSGRKYVCEGCLGGMLAAIYEYAVTHEEVVDD